MFSLLTSGVNIERGGSMWPDLDHVFTYINKNKQSLLNYMQTESLHVSNGHILLKLISVMSLNATYNVEQTIAQIQDQELQTAHSVGMGTTHGDGAVYHHGVFEGRCYEKWLAYNGSSSVGQLPENKIEPITCHWQPFDSLNFWMRESAFDVAVGDVALFSVDLVALGTLWAKYVKRMGVENISRVHFVQRELLPRILNSIAAVTVFNRYSKLLVNRVPEYENNRTVPMWLDAQDRFNIACARAIEDLVKRKAHPDQLLSTIQLTDDRVLADIVKLPQLPVSVQTDGFIATVQWPVIIFLLRFDKIAGGVMNASLKRDLGRRISLLKNSKVLFAKNSALKEQQKKWIDDINALL